MNNAPILNKKKLNKRETEIVSVMVDLFLKGTPETRIANFCHLKKMSNQQVLDFLFKLPLPKETSQLIFASFVSIGNGFDFDNARNIGRSLDMWRQRELLAVDKI